MTVEKTTRASDTTTLRLWDSAKERLRKLSDQTGLTQTEITNAALMQFDAARYLRERAEQVSQQAA